MKSAALPAAWSAAVNGPATASADSEGRAVLKSAPMSLAFWVRSPDAWPDTMSTCFFHRTPNWLATPALVPVKIAVMFAASESAFPPRAAMAAADSSGRPWASETAAAR